MTDPLDIEVDRNFDAFIAVLPTLLPQRKGQFAVMRHGELDSFHPSEGAALRAGRATFDDAIFSIQEVTDRAVDLGFFSHAIDTRIA